MRFIPLANSEHARYVGAKELKREIRSNSASGAAANARKPQPSAWPRTVPVPGNFSTAAFTTASTRSARGVSARGYTWEDEKIRHGSGVCFSTSADFISLSTRIEASPRQGGGGARTGLGIGLLSLSLMVCGWREHVRRAVGVSIGDRRAVQCRIRTCDLRLVRIDLTRNE